MILHSPRAIMPGNTRRLVSIGPFRFTSTECHQASDVVSAKGAIGAIVPALLTNASITELGFYRSDRPFDRVFVDDVGSDRAPTSAPRGDQPHRLLEFAAAT